MRKLNQKGSLLIFLTLGFALLATFIGFAVDFGRAYLSKARISRLVDGASLAAAKVLQGQAGYENQATRAACDSMAMNGAPVVMSGPGTCVATSGSPFTATINFLDVPVGGGPPIKHVQVTGNEPTPTTFLRFLGFMVPGNFSTINVSATAQAAPERPVDLMLVLDRSGSMTKVDGTNTPKIVALRSAVTTFLSLSNTFSADDRIGMVSFASRGCGSGGQDSAVNGPCTPDVTLDFATTSHLNTLKNSVEALVASGGTNTMEALRTARPPLAQAFDDVNRATTRKAVLLVTDGQPTFMRRDSDSHCKKNPKDNSDLPATGNSNASGGPFNSGCIQGVPVVTTPTSGVMFRHQLNPAASSACYYLRIPGTWTSTGCPTNTTNQGNSMDPMLYRNTIACTRSMTGYCSTDGAMHEANVIRNCGYGNSACSSGGEHDVIIFVIAIGQKDLGDPQSSLDENAKCLLARIANATDIVNAATGVVETMAANCDAKFTTIDGDTHADLTYGCSGACTINTTQEKGKVFTVDVTGNVTTQLQEVFNDIAALLKLRLVL